MYGGTGWLIRATADGYVLQEGSEHEVASRPLREFTIDRREATVVKLRFRAAGSGGWLRHDDPATGEFLEIEPARPTDAGNEFRGWHNGVLPMPSAGTFRAYIADSGDTRAVEVATGLPEMDARLAAEGFLTTAVWATGAELEQLRARVVPFQELTR